MRDLLTSRERFGLLLIDEQPDRIVTFPLITAHAARILGCSVKEYCTEGTVLGKAQVAAWKLYGHDALSIFTGSGIIAEASGSKFQVRENDIPILIDPVLKNYDDLDMLTPPDPYTNERLFVYIEAIDHCYETVGDLVPVIAFIPAPFTTAAQIRGIAGFLKDTLQKPENAQILLEKCTKAAELFIDACMEHGALPMLVDPLASCSIISPRIFQKFALPYIKRLTDFMHLYDLDTMLHICGETELIIDNVPETGTELFSFDKTDCNKAKDAIGGSVRLIGNVSPQELLHGTPETIAPMVRDTVLALKDTPKGCVIATGCEIAINTPPDNVRTFIETSRKYGIYW